MSHLSLTHRGEAGLGRVGSGREFGANLYYLYRVLVAPEKVEDVPGNVEELAAMLTDLVEDLANAVVAVWPYED